MRYIELNPLRANMVTHPDECKWSSHPCNALGKSDTLVTLHPRYEALGNTTAARQQAYRELFRRHVDNDTLHEIRGALNHDTLRTRSNK